MKKIMCIFGTRPEAIKMGPLINKINTIEKFKTVVCLTGQHREMLNQVIDIFKIKVDYNFNLMKTNQSLLSLTTEIMNKTSEIIEKEKPDLILVHGDTTTSLAASLAAFYNNIPVGHVEAGLRTYNKLSPYPEEFNRQAVDIIADLYFAPTDNDMKNLIKEGKSPLKIFVTGNTVIDAMKTTISDNYNNENFDWTKNSRMLLLTTHRRENIGDSMRNIFRAVRRIVNEFDDVKVIYPVHLNPVVREIANFELSKLDSVRLIEPVDVVEFHNLMNKCYLILTDSGGIQEEATSLGKPVLVLRDTTERPEGVDAGVLKLVGTEETKIYEEISNLLNNNEDYEKMSKSTNLYGDGHASEKIIDVIMNYFEEI